ncbi:MAG: hypothetical protein K2G20_00370 [Lachnospiraceae bacterium]|nr:hypothetical protein [Lachnospiraceae bacterium]
MKKRKQKNYLSVGVLLFLAAIWLLPIKADAFCSEWGEVLDRNEYCATPVCYTGNRSYFIDHKYKRLCSTGLWQMETEWRIEKVNHGCCDHY